MTRLRMLAALAAAAVLAACSGDAPTRPEPKPQPRPGIHVVLAGASDTVKATPAQALVVEVRGPQGNLAAGVVVRFESVAIPAPANCRVVNFSCEDRPGVLVTELVSEVFATVRSEVTSPEGRASVRLQFGTWSGEGKVLVTVPEFGFQDTVRIAVRPGSAQQVVVVPRDTAVYVNTSFVARGVPIDRHGNARPEAAQLSAGSGLGVEGTTVTARDYGLHHLTAQYQDLPVKPANISVVPRGTLAAVKRDWKGDSIVIVDLDGSNRRRLPTGSTVNGLAWTPDGSRLVASLGEYFAEKRLHSITLDGVRTLLVTGASPDAQLNPVFSANGQWLFFMGDYGEVFRARPDGSSPERLVLLASSVNDVGPSPDGSRFAIASSARVYEVGTGAATNLNGAGGGALRWSPAGSLLAFNSRDWGVGIINADGTGLRRLTGWINQRDPLLNWSPDGKWIVFHGGEYLELIQAETGRRIPLPYAPWHLQPAWRP